MPHTRHAPEWAPSRSDPVRLLIAHILKLVPASYWSFARFQRAGSHSAEYVLSADGEADTAQTFRMLHRERTLQLRAGGVRARGVAPTRCRLPERYAHGVTLLFADERCNLGLMVLFRTAQLGGFTPLEIRTLNLVVDASTDLLSPLPGGEIFNFTQRSMPEMLILDGHLNVILSRPSTGANLPRAISSVVSSLTATWRDPEANASPVSVKPLPEIMLHLQPLHAASGELHIGVLIECARHRRSLGHAAAQYGLSGREIETLALLLNGETIRGIAKRMHLMPSTVRDHIASLITKTGASNRSNLIAKVLGWQNSSF